MAGTELSLVEAAGDLVKTVGVPTAVTFWLLFRTDKRLDMIIALLGGRKEK